MNVEITAQQALELAEAAEAGRDKVYVDQGGLSESLKALRAAAKEEEPSA